jgi:hypothetical protein
MEEVDFTIITDAQEQLAAVPWGEPVRRLDPTYCTYCARNGDWTRHTGLVTRKYHWTGMPNGWLATRCADHEWNQGEGSDDLMGEWNAAQGICPRCFTIRSARGTCFCT